MNANNQGGSGQRPYRQAPNQNGFTPRTKGGNKKRRVNKDGVLTLLFVALIAIIVIVLIVFLVKAIASSGEPSKTTEPSQTASTPAQTTATVPSSTSSTTPTETTQSGGVDGYAAITLSQSGVFKGPLVIINETHQYTMPTGDDNTLTSCTINRVQDVVSSEKFARRAEI
jgi:cytoskeletal protein RodZ